MVPTSAKIVVVGLFKLVVPWLGTVVMTAVAEFVGLLLAVVPAVVG